MIFENHFGGASNGDDARPAAPRPAREVLAACVAEAERHAGEVARIDREVGSCFAGGKVSLQPRTLQHLDLLRQEAEGLARALRLAVSKASPEALVDASDIARCVPLAAQRARLMS